MKQAPYVFDAIAAVTSAFGTRLFLRSMCRVSCAHRSRLLLSSFEVCMIARVPPLTPNALDLLLQTLYTMLTWPCSPTLPHPTDLEHALANNLVRTSMIYAAASSLAVDHA